MTRLITIFIILVVIFCGWQFYQYWEREVGDQQKQAQSAQLHPERLPGMPSQLEQSYNSVKNQGPQALKEWLDRYGSMLQDPRKAWIELDYCVAVTRDNPAEARRIFAEVKARTPHSSPIWPRIQQLESSYE